MQGTVEPTPSSGRHAEIQRQFDRQQQLQLGRNVLDRRNEQSDCRIARFRKEPE
jgi:hypothetical protein